MTDGRGGDRRGGPGAGRYPGWRPIVALALVAPSIPELLTGSTPVTRLLFDPVGFLLSFLGLVALYGGGALLIREFRARRGGGWTTVLLLGAAYGIVEEGFAVHTFFAPGGAPVFAFATYGQWAGVDWLWALGLTVFHSVYSIALPILIVDLWFPESRDAPWLGRVGVGLTAAAYLGIVALFARVVGHGPTPAAFGFFLALAVGLVGWAALAPPGLLSPRPGRARASSWVIGAAAALPFTIWTLLLLQSERPLLSASAAAVPTLLAGATG